MTCIALLSIAAAANLLAQPGIGQNGVVNAASRIPPTLAGGALARGARFTIYGVRLGIDEQSTSLSVGALRVKPISVTPTQIDAVLPDQTPLGKSPLVVTVNGLASKPFPVVVVLSNPGIYSRNGLGWGPGLIKDVNENAPARPRQKIRISTTGLGNAANVAIVIGNRTVRVSRRQGEDDLTFQIPAAAPEGCHVPLYIQAAPLRASNVVTVSISASGRQCEPGPLKRLSADAVGVVVLARSKMLARKSSVDSVEDEATAVFAARNGQPTLSPLLLLPPPGSCTAYTSSMQATTLLPNTISAALAAELEGRGMDAGPKLTLSRDSKALAVSRVRGSPGYYRARIPLFLEAGEVTITGAGGPQVGAFQISVAAPSPFEWTNRAQSAQIDRRKPLSLRWSGIAGDRIVVILGTNVGQLSTAIGTCLCTARALAGEFTIPPSLLANIPESIDIPGIPYDRLFLASLPAAPQKLQAKGIAGGAVFPVYAVGRAVEFK